VNKPASPSAAANPARENIGAAQRKRALRAEAIGGIVIAFVILLCILLRYGPNINWSAR